MADDAELAGLDPYDLMTAETARLEQFFAGLTDADWQKPSRCTGWSVRDVLAHLAASEEYNRATLDGTVQQFLADVGAKGVTDLASANDLGIRGFDGQSPQQILDEWRARITRNTKELRARDGSQIDTSIGAYPARRQAFHLAFELATHADDIGVPVTASEADPRIAWQAHFARFALHEVKPDLTIVGHDGRTHVRGEGLDLDLADGAFVAAVAARLPATTELGDDAASTLSVTP